MPASEDLHLLIDARMLQAISDGAGNYVHELLPRLARLESGTKLTLIVHSSRVDFWREVIPQAAIVVSDASPVGVANQSVLPLSLWKLRPDIFFCPTGTPPVSAPGKLVFTVHDLTPLTHQPYFETFSTPKTLAFRAMVWGGLQRATKIIAVSNYTKRCIAEQFGQSYAARTEVVYHGYPDLHAAPRERSTPEDEYLLYVGSDRPHKNVPRLLQAYKLACDEWPGMPRLTLAGYLRNPSEMRLEVERLGLTGRVRVLGYVEDEHLEQLYRTAAVIVFPSLAEGFGLPVLEAMRRGLPVLTSDASATGEVAGDAALLVDPYDARSIADGLVRISRDRDLRKRLVAAGNERFRLFDWDKAAAETRRIVRSALSA